MCNKQDHQETKDVDIHDVALKFLKAMDKAHRRTASSMLRFGPIKIKITMNK
jgi:hypothetical protein